MAGDRITVQEAARRLGVKDDAIRKRIQRGTLRHDKDPDGRVYVYLDATHDKAHDTFKDTTQYAVQDTGQAELVEVLRDEVAHLREQLDQERESRRRADTIIAQLSQANAEQARTIRAIEAPPPPDRPPGQPASAGEGTEGVEAPDRGGGPETATQSPEPRSWWRRLFGV